MNLKSFQRTDVQFNPSSSLKLYLDVKVLLGKGRRLSKVTWIHLGQDNTILDL
jgi:hypothetical protein